MATRDKRGKEFLETTQPPTFQERDVAERGKECVGYEGENGDESAAVSTLGVERSAVCKYPLP